MWREIFGLVGIYTVFRWVLAGPAFIEKVEEKDEWDQTPVDASQIDHDLSVFAGPDSQHPDNIGRIRSLQEQRNMLRATEARPLLDEFHFTRDNSRKLELLIE